MSKQVKMLFYDYRRAGDDEHEVVVLLARLKRLRYPESAAFEGRYIMRCHVLVDGQEVVDNRRFVDVYGDADAIRLAVKRFDELVAAHPVFGAPKAKEADDGQ